MLSVSAITNMDDLIASRDAWNALLAISENHDNVFLRCEWFVTWWRCFGLQRDLNIIVVREDNNNVVAIFPLMIEHEIYFGISTRKILAIFNDHTFSYDFILSKEFSNRAGLITALFSYLKNEKWDVIEISDILSTALAVELVKEMAKIYKLKYHFSSMQYGLPYVSVDYSFEKYYQSLGKETQKSLMRSQRNLEKLGSVVFEEVDGCSVNDSLLEEFYNTEFQSWKGRQGTAISCIRDVKQFYTDFAKVGAENGWLMLYFLKLNDKRIAGIYCLKYNNIIYALKMGSMDNYSKFSPGNILVERVLRTVFASNMRRFEYLGNFNEQKRRMTKTGRYVFSVYLYNSGMFSKILYTIRFGFKSYLKRFKFIVRIKNSITLMITQDKEEHVKHGS